MYKHYENTKPLLHYGDMTDSSSLVRVIQKIKPDELGYSLKAIVEL